MICTASSQSGSYLGKAKWGIGFRAEALHGMKIYAEIIGPARNMITIEKNPT